VLSRPALRSTTAGTAQAGRLRPLAVPFGARSSESTRYLHLVSAIVTLTDLEKPHHPAPVHAVLERAFH